MGDSGLKNFLPSYKMSSENSGGSYPALDATSPTDSVIAGDFGSLSAQEQERQRDEWKAELSKTEEEIITLRQVLASKEAHAQGLKRRFGITVFFNNQFAEFHFSQPKNGFSFWSRQNQSDSFFFISKFERRSWRKRW